MNTKNIVIGLLILIIGLGTGYSVGKNGLMSSTTSQTTRTEMSASLGDKDAEFDLRFINEMIKHHQGAITMAKQAQQNSDRPEIKNMANDIITAQSKEIDQMNKWKEEWYGNR